MSFTKKLKSWKFTIFDFILHKIFFFKIKKEAESKKFYFHIHKSILFKLHINKLDSHIYPRSNKFHQHVYNILRLFQPFFILYAAYSFGLNSSQLTVDIANITIKINFFIKIRSYPIFYLLYYNKFL